MVFRTNASTQTAFIDLATFSELEAFLYGGCEACTYFVRGIKKANWFSFLPACLRHVSGVPDFGNQFSASINRSGDYVLAFWLRVRVPLVGISTTAITGQAGYVAGVDSPPALRWTRKFMHNLVARVNISFNELVVAELDSNWLDFNAEFRLWESKRVGYNNMIGDILQMTAWTVMSDGVNFAANTQALGTGGHFDLVVPFWFGEDSGVALPAAALPFNDIKVNFELRNFDNLIVMDPGTTAGARGVLTKANIVAGVRNTPTVAPAAITFSATGPVTLSNNVESWATYAIVHNDERVKIGKAPRDILIQQVQRANGFTGVNFQVGTAAQTSTDLRFSHSIIGLFWAAQNVSNEGALSNYTTVPYFATTPTASAAGSLGGGGLDPIAHTALVYESTNRVDMDSDFYSLVAPYLHSTRVPDETGYHYLSYALRTWEYDPLGSTNYSKLANVSLVSDSSLAANSAALGFGQNDNIGGGGDLSATIQPGVSTSIPIGSNAAAAGGLVVTDGDGQAQTWQYVIRALNWNISRVSGGSLGLPVL